MPLKVSEHLQQRLAEVINDLRDAVEQEAAKAYLISIFNIVSVKFEPEAELCNNSWMKFINKDCMSDTSHSLYSLLLLLSEKIKKPLLQMTNSLTEADIFCSAFSSQIVSTVSSKQSTIKRLCKHCQKLKIHHKRERSTFNTLKMIV